MQKFSKHKRLKPFALFVLLMLGNLAYCQSIQTVTPIFSKSEVKKCQENVIRNGDTDDYNDLWMSWSDARENTELLIPYALILAVRYDYEKACGDVFWLVKKYYKEQQMEMDANTMAFLLVLLEKGVALGSEDCARYLADLYLKEEYLPRDTVLAVAYLEKVAGSEKSLYSDLYHDLFELYMKGEYVKQDKAKAIDYLEKGSEKGKYGCIRELYLTYLKGMGVEQDIPKAIEYLEKGIEKGVSNCFHSLGNLYIEGEYVQQDIAKGLEYLERGADAENIVCLQALHNLYEEGKYVQKDLNKAKEYERRRWKIMTKGH